MALTTGSQSKFNNPDATIAGKPQRISAEAAILFDKSIVARPLNRPEVASIHVKNTANYYRWVNRLHSHGSEVERYKAMGFTFATSDDVEVLVGDIVPNEHEFRTGDVVLMKIPFERWAAHAKHNMETGMKLQAMRGVHKKDEELDGDVYAEGGSGKHEAMKPLAGGKVTPFIPSDPDAIIEGTAASDAEKARKTIGEIRQNIRAGRPVTPAPKE